MNDSNNNFLELMKGVNPLKKSNRIEKEKSKTQRIKNKTKKPVIKTTQITPNEKKNLIKREFNLEKINIKKSIKKGFFKIDKKIDFHGKTLLDSEEQFSSEITQCYNSGMRCLLFVTGKGLFKTKDLNDIKKPKLYHGVIRSSLVNWVNSKKFSKYILSYEQASIEHGGDGAFYIYLRKKKN